MPAESGTVRSLNNRVSSVALREVNAACAFLVKADALSLADAGRAIEAAVAAARESNGAPRTVAWSDFHRAVARAGRLIGAIGEWQRHRRALLFPEEREIPGYSASGRAVSLPAGGSVTLEG